MLTDKSIGNHKGLEHFTIGQAVKKYAVQYDQPDIPERVYAFSSPNRGKPIVAGFDVEKNVVYLVSNQQSKENTNLTKFAFSQTCLVDDIRMVCIFFREKKDFLND